MPKKSRPPREIAAHALCRAAGHPENIRFEGKPMWQSFLREADAVMDAFAAHRIYVYGAGALKDASDQTIAAMTEEILKDEPDL